MCAQQHTFFIIRLYIYKCVPIYRFLRLNTAFIIIIYIVIGTYTYIVTGARCRAHTGLVQHDGDMSIICDNVNIFGCSAERVKIGHQTGAIM